MAHSAQDYLEGALLRHEEAWTLYEKQRWVGAIYLAGRSVEALFRCLLTQKEDPIAVGHDLREYLKRVRRLVPLTERESTSIENSVNEVAIVWRNDLRYTGERRMMRILRNSERSSRIGRIRVKGDPLKANAKRVLEACGNIITRGEPLCHRSKKS